MRLNCTSAVLEAAVMVAPMSHEFKKADPCGLKNAARAPHPHIITLKLTAHHHP